MSDLQFRIGYGACSWSHGSTKILAFTPKDGERVFPKEVFVQSGRPAVQNASSKTHARGIWSWATLTHIEGRILIFQTTWSRGGALSASSAKLIWLREEAALIQLSAATIQAKDNIHPSVIVFQGRGDILTPREANLLGAKLPLRWIEAYMENTPDEEELIWTQNELAPEVSTKPKIRKAKVAGETKVVVDAPRRRRKIKIRRR